nr:hypothetical protein [Mycobacterium colombiense]
MADEEVVEEDPDHGAGQGADDRDPPVLRGAAVIAGEGQLAPTHDVGERTRSQVACGVERVARVGAVGASDHRDDEADDQRRHVARRRLVAMVDQRGDQGHQDGGAHQLVHQGTQIAAVEVLGGERREDRVGVLRLRSAQVVGRVVVVDGRAVDGVHRRSGAERAEQLGDPVRNDVAPVELSRHGEGQRDRRIQVRTADAAGDVGREHHRERPTEHDDQPVRRAERHRLPARPGQADDVEGAGAESEQQQDEGAEELGEHGAGQPGAQSGHRVGGDPGVFGRACRCRFHVLPN